MLSRDVPGSSFLGLVEDAKAQQFEAGAAIHLAFDELEPMHLAFGVTLTLRRNNGPELMRAAAKAAEDGELPL